MTHYRANPFFNQLAAVVFFTLAVCAPSAHATLTLETGSARFHWQLADGIIIERQQAGPSKSYTLDKGIAVLSVADPENTARLSFEPQLLPFEDEFGGYGSDLYAHLEFFQVESSLPDQTREWFGWQNRYDVEALTLASPDWRIITAELKPESGRLDLALAYQGTGDRTLRIEYLKRAADRATLAEVGLDAIVLKDVWLPFRWLCGLIWDLLDLLYFQFNSWGLAIVALALMIRVLTVPVTKVSLRYQQAALEQQRRIGTKVAGLKENYTGLELSEKMVALYEQENYDHLAPFKGMLGLMIQIPILIALFTVIGEMSALREQSFLWIEDLSLSDRVLSLGTDLPFFGGYFNLLPFLMAAATVSSTWLSGFFSEVKVPLTSLYGMSLVFFIFFYSFPAALVLYWFASNVFQMLHQVGESLFTRARG